MTPPWVVCAPMRIEAAALRRGVDPGWVRHTGVGARRAHQAAAGLDGSGFAAVTVAGVAGGLRAALRAGDVVVADRVRTVDGSISVDCPAAPLVAGALRRRGLTVHIGSMVSADHLVHGAFRQRLAATGALAADTESAWLLGGTAATGAAIDGGWGGAALACVRVVADSPPGAVFQPATLARLGTALRALPQVATALAEFAAAATVSRVVLAAPGSLTAVAAGSDVVLVLGSTDSSDARRLLEVASRAGAAAHLVDDVHAINLRWLAGARTVGVTAGACAPSALVDDVVAALRGLGAGEVVERTATVEQMHFTLPKEVRRS